MSSERQRAYAREWYRKTYGCKPRPSCPHGAVKKSSCKPCRRAWDLQRYNRDKQKRRAANETWKSENRERYKTKQFVAKQRWLGLPKPGRPAPLFCECCGKGQTKKGVKRLDLDHDHKTGKFRGWLCNTCNRGIGMFGDTIDGVRKALDYLERARLVS